MSCESYRYLICQVDSYIVNNLPSPTEDSLDYSLRICQNDLHPMSASSQVPDEGVPELAHETVILIRSSHTQSGTDCMFHMNKVLSPQLLK